MAAKKTKLGNMNLLNYYSYGYYNLILPSDLT